MEQGMGRSRRRGGEKGGAAATPSPRCGRAPGGRAPAREMGKEGGGHGEEAGADEDGEAAGADESRDERIRV